VITLSDIASRRSDGTVGDARPVNNASRWNFVRAKFPRDNRAASKFTGWGTRRTGPDTATGDTMAGFGALQRFKLQVRG
jgi:hypothetical protein